MKLKCVIAVFAVFLAGCATSPVSLSEATSVPPAHQFAFSSATPAASATIVVIRDSGMMDAGCYTAVYVDGDLAATLQRAQKATFHVKPGEHVLRYGVNKNGTAFCHVLPKRWGTHETTLRAGQTKHFRLRIDTNGQFNIERSEALAH